jgi:hypothetical protein
MRKTFCVKGSWGSFGLGKGARGVKLITYPQLVLRLKTGGIVPPVLQ